MTSSKPLFVSYYTTNGNYPKQAKRLADSFRKHDIEFEIDELPPFSSWVKANSHRVPFIAEKLLKHRRPIIWIDCDCEIVRYPDLLFKDTDFSIINWYAIRGTHLDAKLEYDPNSKKALFSGGVSKLAPPAIALLIAWRQLVLNNPTVPEDQVLSWVWNNCPKECETVRFAWLPKSYLAGLFSVPEGERVIQTEFQPYKDVEHREMVWRKENEVALVHTHGGHGLQELTERLA